MSENLSSHVVEALPAIERLAKKVWRSRGGRLRQGPEMIDDLRNEGVEAFLRTMDAYDENRGTSPMQYAYKGVYGAMLNFLKIYPPDVVSLDEPIYEDDDEGQKKIDLVASGEENVEEMLIRKASADSVNRAIANAIQGLTNREEQIAEAIFQEGESGSRVAEKLSVSESRISELKGSVVKKIRKELTGIDEEALERLNNQDIQIIDKDGVVELPDSRKAVYLPRYVEYIKQNHETVRSAIKARGITPLKSVRGIYRNGDGRLRLLYLKEAVDRITINVCELDTNGIGVLPGGKEVVCIDPYARYLGINGWSLKRKIHAHKIAPIPGILGRVTHAGRQTRTVQVYPRETVDILLEILKSSRRHPGR